MKKILVFLFPLLWLCACTKNNSSPGIDTVTSGSKWNLVIGSSPENVYAQLQVLGTEKKFWQVAVVGRLPYSSPQQVQALLPFYHFITLEKNAAVVERALIQFTGDSVTGISAGGALPEEISKWPQDQPDDIAIHTHDPVSQLYTKLAALYRLPAYSSYSLTLPDKPLQKPFDPDMANYTEWAFSMTERVRPQVDGRHAVRLYFKDHKLYKIQDEYSEHTVFN
jgi:hypothetical protein